MTAAAASTSQAASRFVAEMRGLAAAVARPAVALEPSLDVVYLAPSGRRCRVFDVHHTGRRATLLYDLKNGSPCHSYLGEGFFLSRANWHLLRRVQP